MNFKNMDIAAAVACCGIAVAVGAIEMKPLGDRWEIGRDRFTDSVQLSVSRRTPSSYNQTSFPVALNELHGLMPEQVRGVQSPVHFELRREAGAFTCDGIMTLGAGAGQFRFSPNRNFVSEMEKLGYWGIGDEALYSLALSDTGVSYASSMRAAGLARVSVEELMDLRRHCVDPDFVRGARRDPQQELIPGELIRLRDHGATSDYLQETARLGYKMDSDEIVKLRDHGVDMAMLRALSPYQSDFPVDGIVKLRDHGVDGRFIHDLYSNGARFNADEIVKLKEHGVDSAYVEHLKEAGFEASSPDAIVKLREHGVDGRFVRELYRNGLRFNADEIVKLKEHGVDSAYVEHLKDAGFQDISPDGIVKLRGHGVQPELISEARKAGYDGLSAEDLVKLHDHGVNGEYIRRLHAGGLKNLTADQMVKLREHGID